MLGLCLSLVSVLGASGWSASSAQAGTILGLLPTHQPTISPTVPAYWLVASDGGIFAFGGAGFYGSTGNLILNKPIVGMAGTPDSKGYWLVASDGGIFAYGDAGFYGSTGSLTLKQPIVGMATTPDGHGYWLVASDGGIFAFGDAKFYGSAGGLVLNKPVVGMTPTPDGGGYWLVASDGGIFAYGDAKFYGSTGNIVLDKPIVGMTATPDGHGYWFVASDGGIFAYGDAKFYGSLGGVPIKNPIVAIADSPDGEGYWFTDSNGAVSPFGDAEYWGSAPQVINKPIVAMAEAAGTGANSGGSYQSGALGYDVSNFQCNEPLPDNGAVRIVEVEGASFYTPNPCLTQEANWAGGGLNLYIFLTYNNVLPSGNTTLPPAACNGDTSCAYGYAAALDAFNKATAAGIYTGVTWWLDVEGAGNWSSNQQENAQMLYGELLGFKVEGINNVGVYTNLLGWGQIMGTYQPPVPVWLAWPDQSSGPNQSPSAMYACANGRSQAATDGSQLPTGPIVLVQFGETLVGGNQFDEDYAC